jgi:hypothetical protein
MHIVCKPRDETITIKLPDNRIFKVTLRNGEAHVPEPIGRYMIEKGYVAQGSAPPPKPSWELMPDGGHGALIDMFEPWVREIQKEPS